MTQYAVTYATSAKATSLRMEFVSAKSAEHVRADVKRRHPDAVIHRIKATA